MARAQCSAGLSEALAFQQIFATDHLDRDRTAAAAPTTTDMADLAEPAPATDAQETVVDDVEDDENKVRTPRLPPRSAPRNRFTGEAPLLFCAVYRKSCS